MKAKQERTNIVLICTDQWRGDCLGLQENDLIETPHLRMLSKEGVNFTNAYSSTPSCIASRAALLTGLSQKNHGFTGYMDKVEWKYETTLPKILSDAGYHTQCVGKMHVYPARNLMGFHNVILHDGYLHCERGTEKDNALTDDYLPWLKDKLGNSFSDYTDTGIGCNGYTVKPWIYDEMLHPTNWVTSQSIDFLRRRDPTKPFFLMMSYHRPHSPLDAPQSFLDRYLDKELPDLPKGDWVDFELADGNLTSPIPHSKDEIDLARKAYYAHLTHIDNQLNRFFISLFEHGLLDNTAIIFISDHGEMLFDHNMVRKAMPFEGSAKIPFILRLPNQNNFHSFKKNTDIDKVVELRDIFPTCCDIADIDIPLEIDGESVLPLCNKDEKSKTIKWREYIHGEHAYGVDSNHWITDSKMKYVWFSQTGRELLFALKDDPLELKDISKIDVEILKKYRNLLISELKDREEGYVVNEELVVGVNPRYVQKYPGVNQKLFKQNR